VLKFIKIFQRSKSVERYELKTLKMLPVA